MKNMDYDELIDLRKKWIKTCACLKYLICALDKDIAESEKELEHLARLDATKNSNIFLNGYNTAKCSISEVNKDTIEGYLEPYMDEIMNFDWKKYEELREDEK